MSTTGKSEILQRLAPATISFVSVKPEPAEGPFPEKAVERLGLRFSSSGGLTIHGTANSGSGSFELSDDGKTITFGGASWTERGLGRQDGDTDGTLVQRMYAAEDFMQAKFSSAAGPYSLTLQNDKLILKSQQDGTELVFHVSP